MPDFHLVEAPVFFPTECLTCKGHTHPDGMVDTLVKIATTASPQARVYLCPVCVTAAAKLLGFAPPEEINRLRERLVEQEQRIEELAAQVDANQPTVVTSLHDLRKLAEGSTAKRAKAKAS